MAHIRSLEAQGLSETFDLARHGTKPIVTFTFKDSTIRLSYVFPGFSFADRTVAMPPEEDPFESAFHHEIGIAGAGFISESGKPLLPSFGRFLQIPAGYRYTVQVEAAGLQKHDDIHIKPAQENDRDQNAWVYEFNRATYDDDKFYPAETVAISPPLYMDGYRVLGIHVRPMQYNPVRKRLHGYSNIVVSIELSAETATGQDRTKTGEVPAWCYQDRAHDLEGFGNFLFNPGRTYFEKRALPLMPMDTPAHRPAIPEFLIICGDVFEGPARRLQAWKQKCGLETAVVPLSKIIATGNADTPRAEQVARLKAYIRSQRKVPLSPLRYVLLFGDISVIPTEERQRPGTSATPQFDTTDFYYFTHRDARGAECLLPWIAGGRIAAAEESEGWQVVEQIIRYEQTPPDDPQYYDRMAVAAYFEDRDDGGCQDGCANKAYLKTMETVRGHMASKGFDVSCVYVSNTRTPRTYCDGTPVPPRVREKLIYKADAAVATGELIRLIDEGQLVIGHRGHGDRFGWLNPPLKTADLTRVQVPSPSVFFSINCRTGSFDGGRECFAEEILALNGGAPTLIAATELSGAWRNDSMIKALFDAAWPGIIRCFPATTTGFPVKYSRIGDIMNYAKAYLLLAHGFNANTQKHLEIYHVVGDPTLPVWTHAPEKLTLQTHLAQNQLNVSMHPCPPGAVLSVWDEASCLLKTEPTGSTLAIPLTELTGLPNGHGGTLPNGPRRLSIFFTAPGHRPAEANLCFKNQPPEDLL